MDRNHDLKAVIAKNIKKLMDKQGLTQGMLSERSSISKSTISDYLNLKTLANPANIQKLADALNVKKSDLDPSFKPKNEPNTLAAHFEGKDFSEKEIEEILEFAEFVRNKRKR